LNVVLESGLGILENNRIQLTTKASIQCHLNKFSNSERTGKTIVEHNRISD
jgi:hypothetical protein